MNKLIVIIGIGGFFGSIARYLTATFFNKAFPSVFPYGTFVANIFGCLLIGLFYGLSEKYNWFTPNWRVFLTTGFCGGYTTFSSFTYENVQLLRTGENLTFFIYTISSFSVGILALFIGTYLAKI